MSASPTHDAADRALDRLEALRDADRAGRPAVADDRHGGGEQRLVERLGLALALVGAAARARRRSRAASRSSGPARRPLAVGEQRPVRVDDDDAAADVARRGLDEPLEVVALARRSRSAADAATTSAWPRACERTSASTRSATLDASGTSSATIASTST